MRTVCTAVVVSIAALSASARAESHIKLGLLEAAIPDVRYEYSITASSDRYVVSVPVAWHAGHVEFSKDRGLGFVHVAEAQWQVTTTEWRGLLGERMLLDTGDSMSGFSPLVEASGVLGTDGYGVVLGTGLTWGYGGAGVTFGLIARYVLTNHEQRMDFALDLMLPLNMLDELDHSY